MNKYEQIKQRTKFKRGVLIVLMPRANYKSVICWTTGRFEMQFIFLGSLLDRRQRGREIRKGLRFYRKQNELPAS